MVVDHGGGNSRPPTVVVQVCINASPVCFSFATTSEIARARKIVDRGNRSGRVPFRLVRVFIGGKPRRNFPKQHLPFLRVNRTNRNETPSGCRENVFSRRDDPSLTQHFAKSFDRARSDHRGIISRDRCDDVLVFFLFLLPPSSPPPPPLLFPAFDDDYYSTGTYYGCNAQCW